MAKKSIEDIAEHSKTELRKEKSGATWVAMVELSEFNKNSTKIQQKFNNMFTKIIS